VEYVVPLRRSFSRIFCAPATVLARQTALTTSFLIDTPLPNGAPGDTLT
jgi:hypothetical protein